MGRRGRESSGVPFGKQGFPFGFVPLPGGTFAEPTPRKRGEYRAGTSDSLER
jgi:hypothetical protein